MAVNKIEGPEIAKEDTKRFLGQTGFLMNKSQVKAPLYHELVNTECPKLKEAMMTLAKKSKNPRVFIGRFTTRNASDAFEERNLGRYLGELEVVPPVLSYAEKIKVGRVYSTTTKLTKNGNPVERSTASWNKFC